MWSTGRTLRRRSGNKGNKTTCLFTIQLPADNQENEWDPPDPTFLSLLSDVCVCVWRGCYGATYFVGSHVSPFLRVPCTTRPSPKLPTFTGMDYLPICTGSERSTQPTNAHTHRRMDGQSAGPVKHSVHQAAGGPSMGYVNGPSSKSGKFLS